MDKDDILKLDNQLCYLIYACSRGITRIYKPLLRSMNLTYPQYLVLLVLWEKNRISLKELGKKLSLDSGTLTPLLKRMEKADILKRERSSVDERVVLLNLTPKGDQLKQKAYGIPEALFCRSGLSPEQFRELKSEMEQLLKQIQHAENQNLCSGRDNN